ncbi:ATP-binding cassette domain-containing protein [Micromonospora sp. NPDC023956]|uniref:ATP-binding cassette domain-containing protein n=1 Tax=Micromonospora sp. NPDC023956 TaxID=3155722 RepID=UPI0033F468CE
MIEARELSKTYGRVRAVDGVSFTASAGRVTGFLGLNGSGKTTTLRMLLGLVTPTSGQALVDGRRYRDLRHPARQVGAVLEQGIGHPGQTGRAHLVTQAVFSGAGRSRVDALLDHVGLGHAADQRVGGYSLGMRQRLAVATALLGDPSILVLDEPANGLDPEGIAWLRGLLRDHARAGGTVLISSHLLAEVAQLVDDVVIIAEGRVVRATSLVDLTRGSEARVRVRGGNPGRLWHVLTDAGARITTDGPALEVAGLSPEQVGELAFRAQVPIYELTVRTPDLEQVFLTLATAR